MVTHAVGTLRNMALQDNAQTIAKKDRGLSFSEVFSTVRGTKKSSENVFSAAFPANDVSVKAGDCKVDDKIWQRKDFPAWRYFQEDAGADCLNHWKPRGKDATGKEAYIQSELKKVGYGKMVTIMPEGLQEKMDADSEFARQIAEKVQDWKINYDKMDNALAASYGDNPAWYQMMKSYCLQLDEKGNVKNYMVVSGGTDTKQLKKTSRLSSS